MVLHMRHLCATPVVLSSECQVLTIHISIRIKHWRQIVVVKAEGCVCACMHVCVRACVYVYSTCAHVSVCVMCVVCLSGF